MPSPNRWKWSRLSSTMQHSESAMQDPESEESSESFEEEHKGLISGLVGSTKSKKRAGVLGRVMHLFLIVSVAINVFQLLFIQLHGSQPCRSLHANLLEHEITQTLHYNTEYSNHETSEDEKEALWQNIDYSEGFITLSHEESDAMGVHRSATFPWDLNKGIYVVHGYHQLHCVVLLHAYTRSAHLGQTPVVSYHHIEHCLDMLRQDFICNADDTPDWTPNYGPSRKTGDNQPRQCRDWSKLSKWAKEHSACYKTFNISYAGQDFGVSHQLDRYTYCPEDSPYRPLVQAYKDMSRPNEGNLDKEAVAAQSPEEMEKLMEVLNAHNAHVTAVHHHDAGGEHGMSEHEMEGHGGDAHSEHAS